jgi:hypothetical protein
VILAAAFEAAAAYAAGWYGGAWVAGETPVGFLGRYAEPPVPGHLIAVAGALAAVAIVFAIYRIARPALVAAIPIFVCFFAFPVWNGYASGFDYPYLQALTHHRADAEALRRMRGADAGLACRDPRMKLTPDAKALCAARSSTLG